MWWAVVLDLGTGIALGYFVLSYALSYVLEWSHWPLLVAAAVAALLLAAGGGIAARQSWAPRIGQLASLGVLLLGVWMAVVGIIDSNRGNDFAVIGVVFGVLTGAAGGILFLVNRPPAPRSA